MESNSGHMKNRPFNVRRVRKRSKGWGLLLALGLLFVGFTPAAHAAVWTPDAAKADWGEDEIYAAYDRWIGDLPEDYLANAHTRMRAIALEEPGGVMDSLSDDQIWDCSSTALYLWTRFLYEHRLPMIVPVAIAAEGGTRIVNYTQQFDFYDSIDDPEDRYLHFAKLLQNLTYVKDLSHRLTYPIGLEHLQGGVVNLSERHTRVLTGVAREGSEHYALLVTGQWIYTERWSSPTAFAQLAPFQDKTGELGLRLFRITVREGNGYRLLEPKEHRRFGGLEQYEARKDFRRRIYESLGRDYEDELILRHADLILREWMDYRNAYVATHPAEVYGNEHASTRNNDRRIVEILNEMEALAIDPAIVAKLGPDFLAGKTFALTFTDYEGWTVRGPISIPFFKKAFEAYVERLSSPEMPLRLRTLRIEDLLEQAVRHDRKLYMPEIVAILANSDQKLNLRKHRVWIRSMPPEVQFDLMPFLDF